MNLAEQVLELHRELIEIPSVSHEEGKIADFVQRRLDRSPFEVLRLGDNVVAFTDDHPKLLFNSHFDTVPPTSDWTRSPFRAERHEGKVFGLGANDAKGCVAAMIVAFEAWALQGNDGLALMLSPEEETGGNGTETAWRHVHETLGWNPEGVLVGEPTELQIGSSQSGLLVLELFAEGCAAHAANAASNPIFQLAEDLLKVREWGGQPTVLTGSTARNQVPATASAIIDKRTMPGRGHSVHVQELRSVVHSRIEVRSQRLEPFACPERCNLVEAIRRAIPSSNPFHSKTMSDLVFFQGREAVKIGPGVSARSHTTDEFIFEDELVAGAHAYLAIAAEVLR